MNVLAHLKIPSDILVSAYVSKRKSEKDIIKRYN